ncbi:hypothetical protein PhCBS80983_g02056 [Powellomyces hirtus]|uniref:Uncharacterized protein n=1 Tax=Powellomyces hirtus TaxID=109895 RepID=A0A507E7G5_9FUNG|nr:hypothetical protein PhCBS80983_g02056 [Powellomyces hirtus]
MTNETTDFLDSLILKIPRPNYETDAESEAFAAGIEAFRKAFEAAPTPGKRSLDTAEESSRKFRKLDPSLVHINLTKSEVDAKIATFIDIKRAQINASNKREFLRPKQSEQDSACARVDAAQLNRTVQMKLDVVHNKSGPLERSTQRDGEGSAASAPTDHPTSLHLEGIEERISNVQEHLNVSFVSRTPLDAFTRIKALEDKIIQLEEDHPAWAAFHFNQPNREQNENLSLRSDPPQTVVTYTSTGEVHTSVIPSSTSTSTPKPPNLLDRPANIQTVAAPSSGPDYRTDNSGRSNGDQDVKTSQTDMESLDRRIQALKDSLFSRQRRL